MDDLFVNCFPLLFSVALPLAAQTAEGASATGWHHHSFGSILACLAILVILGLSAVGVGYGMAKKSPGLVL